MSKASEAASEEPAVEFDGPIRLEDPNNGHWIYPGWRCGYSRYVCWYLGGNNMGYVGYDVDPEAVGLAWSWGLGRGGWNTPSWWAGSALSTTQTSTNDACASELIGHRRRDGKVGDGRGLLHNGEVARLGVTRRGRGGDNGDLSRGQGDGLEGADECTRRMLGFPVYLCRLLLPVSRSDSMRRDSVGDTRRRRAVPQCEVVADGAMEVMRARRGERRREAGAEESGGGGDAVDGSGAPRRGEKSPSSCRGLVDNPRTQIRVSCKRKPTPVPSAHQPSHNSDNVDVLMPRPFLPYRDVPSRSLLTHPLRPRTARGTRITTEECFGWLLTWYAVPFYPTLPPTARHAVATQSPTLPGSAQCTRNLRTTQYATLRRAIALSPGLRTRCARLSVRAALLPPARRIFRAHRPRRRKVMFRPGPEAAKPRLFGSASRARAEPTWGPEPAFGPAWHSSRPRPSRKAAAFRGEKS
ncbi:hypothetical protein C8R45DRAFT_1080917 [Mycena sanguinolenta]|nr:hypothetical protein C8R45DRAFT_1080917 [Mycena sanguinolenta]